MKYSIFFLFLMVSCSVGRNTSMKSSSETSENILHLHERKFQWMVNNQLDSLHILLDENVKYIHSNGWIETKTEVIENIKNKKLIYHSVKIVEANVEQHAHTFVITGKGHFSVSLNGKFIEIPLLYTEVYVKKLSGIHLIHRHACRWNEN